MPYKYKSLIHLLFFTVCKLLFLSHLNFITFLESKQGSLSPFGKMRERRFIEGTWLSQGHTVGMWQSWILTLVSDGKIQWTPGNWSPHFSSVQMCFKYYFTVTTLCVEAKAFGLELPGLGSSPYLSRTLVKPFCLFGPMSINFFIYLHFRTPIFYIINHNSYYY